MSSFRQASRFFFWGFDGTSVSRPFGRFLKKYPPAGVILFRRNIESPRQLAALTKELRRAVSSPILIGIDQEGGRVSRLGEPFMQYPPAQVLGRLAARENFYELIYETARFMGNELRSLGINLNFAPVLDVNSNPKNPIIGDRAFSSKPAEVARAGVSFFTGLMKEGVVPCGKHFPGHGNTTTDSHFTLPIVKKSEAAIKRLELLPFQVAAQNRIPMLMTAHVLYPALDPVWPATLSRAILTDLLRRQMNYRGVVITDDLEMKGVSANHSLLESSLLSFAAGCDLLMVCRGGEKREGLVEDFGRLVSWSPALQKRAEESLKRLMILCS